MFAEKLREKKQTEKQRERELTLSHFILRCKGGMDVQNASVHELAEETGFTEDTLYAWRIQYRSAPGGAEGRWNHSHAA